MLDDAGEETLINPTMREMEHWSHNARQRIKKPAYTPYEEEVDQWGKVKEARLLGKYDDDDWASQPNRTTFRLGQYAHRSTNLDNFAIMFCRRTRLSATS